MGIRRSSCKRPACALSRVLLLLLLCFKSVFVLSMSTLSDPTNRNMIDSNQDNNNAINVAHLGNSIQYYNDLPRFLQHMVSSSSSSSSSSSTPNSYYQNSCLRGGATLSSLFEKGNGMGKKFGPDDMGAATVTELLTTSTNKEWNFIILNDHTQSPARELKRNQSLHSLKEHYMPLFQSSSSPIIIFLQTAAYRYPDIHNSSGLGDFDTFTNMVVAGLQHYTALVPNSKIAPVGNAYRLMKEHDGDGWEKLYARDNFHPSPHGTYLQACVLYCTMFSNIPPAYNQSWWENARYMQPPDVEPLPIPTEEEAQILHRIACQACGIKKQGDGEEVESSSPKQVQGEEKEKILNKDDNNKNDEGTQSRL